MCHYTAQWRERQALGQSFLPLWRQVMPMRWERGLAEGGSVHAPVYPVDSADGAASCPRAMKSNSSRR